jgi:hypothetical protein
MEPSITRCLAGLKAGTTLGRLERVRAVRPDRELQLKQELIGGRSVGVIRPAVLTAQLAELAGPEREQRGKRLVAEIVFVESIRLIDAAAGEPAPRELVVAGDRSPTRRYGWPIARAGSL